MDGQCHSRVAGRRREAPSPRCYPQAPDAGRERAGMSTPSEAAAERRRSARTKAAPPPPPQVHHARAAPIFAQDRCKELALGFLAHPAIVLISSVEPFKTQPVYSLSERALPPSTVHMHACTPSSLTRFGHAHGNQTERIPPPFAQLIPKSPPLIAVGQARQHYKLHPEIESGTFHCQRIR